MDRLLTLAKRFVHEAQDDDVTGLAAQLAYRFLFAIFPFGLFVAALAGFIAAAAGVQDPTQQVIGALGDNLPPNLASSIRPQVETVLGERRPGLLSFGALVALWAATGGTMALMKAMNRAYDIDEGRSFIGRYALAVGLTLLATVGLLAGFVTIVGASLLTQEIAGRLGLSPVAFEAITLLRWPAVIIAVGLAVGILYRLAPDTDEAPWPMCLSFGVAFGVLWVIATAGFAFYVSNFGNYANTYGALSGAIILLLWFYLTSLLLVGLAELMVVILKQRRDDGARRDGQGQRGDQGSTSS